MIGDVRLDSKGRRLEMAIFNASDFEVMEQDLDYGATLAESLRRYYPEAQLSHIHQPEYSYYGDVGFSYSIRIGLSTHVIVPVTSQEAATMQVDEIIDRFIERISKLRRDHDAKRTGKYWR